MIAESSKQLELDLSALAGAASADLGQVQREYESFRQAHFEFHSEVSRDVRALIQENAELKSQVCAHPRMLPGLDRAHCPDCSREFLPRTREYKSLLEDASTTPVHPPEDSKRHTVASGWVEKYLVKRRWEHYRYCWQPHFRGKTHRLHIPKDCGKLAEVRSAVAQGRTCQEIQQLIRSWSSLSCPTKRAY